MTLPAGWTESPLGDLCRNKPNNGIFRKNDEYEDRVSHGIPVVWVEELFRGNQIDVSKSRRIIPQPHEIEKYGLKYGDLLFCRSSLKLDGIAFNNVYLGEDDRALFECHLIRLSLDLSRVFPIYLNWLMRSPRMRAQAKLNSKTATMTTIDQHGLCKIVIPLPPLSEQKRLADILDRAEAIRAKRRAALAILDELTQSIFLDMFGDPALNPHGFPLVPLSSLIRENDRLNYGVVQPGEDVPDGVPLVRVSDLDGTRIDESNLKRIAPEIESAYKRSRLKGDEILISCVGSVGTIALVEESQKGFNVARAIARVPLNDKCDRVFVAEYLRSNHVQRYFIDELRTVSQPTLNIKQIGETEVQLPPYAMQQEFAKRKTEVDQLRQHHTKSQELTDDCFSSLQQRAFRGDL